MPRKVTVYKEVSMNKKMNSENLELLKKCSLVVIFFGIIILFRHFVIDKVVVNGVSMEETYSEGDVLWVRKYDLSDIERFDIVIAYFENQKVVKRVIGVPNDTIHIADGCVYVNGMRLEEDIDTYMEEGGIAEEEIVLSGDEYFLLGDNRNNSYDSRLAGPVAQEDIEGVVITKIFPWW